MCHSYWIRALSECLYEAQNKSAGWDIEEHEFYILWSDCLMNAAVTTIAVCPVCEGLAVGRDCKVEGGIFFFCANPKCRNNMKEIGVQWKVVKVHAYHQKIWKFKKSITPRRLEKILRLYG